MIKKIVIAFVVYSIVLLFIGRNLSFLPAVNFSAKKEKTEDIRKEVIEKFLKSKAGAYSIYYKDLKTGHEFGINENKVLTAASLNKLLIISYLYNLAGNKKIDLEEKIVIQKDDIQDYGTGSIRYGGEGKPYSLKTLAMLALEQSDNTAAHVLSLRLEEGKIQEFGKSLGLVATNMVDNKTTAREMGDLLELIYSKKITNEPLTAEFLDFMKDTDFEDRLARYVPKNIAIYHKAADATNMVHDAGIIDPSASVRLRSPQGTSIKSPQALGASRENPFILAVLTSDIKDEEDAKKTIGKLAEFIYGKTN